MKKANVAIIGTGNIGIDLMYKILKSDNLSCYLFSGRSSNSEGIAIAKALEIKTSANSIEAIIEDAKNIDIVFDATSASSHVIHAPLLEKLKIFTIDLTPAKIGKMCVPAINLQESLNVLNVNTITCGGQATIPIISAIKAVHKDIEYLEIVASISSRSAGMGTRENIDEFTQTTKDAIIKFSGVQKAKAIIILNPAEPPIKMRNTIYAKISNPDIEKIAIEVNKMVQKIKEYVKGYNVIVGPLIERGHVTITIEVVGAGDYLPSYSGNLDIITCAAVKIAEEYVQKREKKN